MDQEQLVLLISRVNQGDMSAFHELFTGFHPGLFRYICGRCRDYDLARDIAQETFIRVWQHRCRLDPNRSFKAFLIKISENLLKDHYRHRSVVDKHRENYYPDNSPAGSEPGENVHFQQLQQALHQIVNRYLPARCRTVFIMSRFEGLSAPEIAATLNISLKTVENQLSRALQLVRKKLIKFI